MIGLDISVGQLLNGIAYAGTVLAGVTSVGVFLHFAAVRPVRRFLRKEIVGALHDIETAVKNTGSSVQSLSDKLEEHIRNGGHHPVRRR